MRQCWPGVVTAVRRRDADHAWTCATSTPARWRRCSPSHAGRGTTAAEAEGCTVECEHIFRIPPMPFHPALLDAAAASVREVEGHDVELPSGALHDASEMAREVPTVMIFSSSTDGLSHTKEEDTPDEHLHMAADAFHRTCRRAIDLVVAGKLYLFRSAFFPCNTPWVLIRTCVRASYPNSKTWKGWDAARPGTDLRDVDMIRRQAEAAAEIVGVAERTAAYGEDGHASVSGWVKATCNSSTGETKPWCRPHACCTPFLKPGCAAHAGYWGRPVAFVGQGVRQPALRRTIPRLRRAVGRSCCSLCGSTSSRWSCAAGRHSLTPTAPMALTSAPTTGVTPCQHHSVNGSISTLGWSRGRDGDRRDLRTVPPNPSSAPTGTPASPNGASG